MQKLYETARRTCDAFTAPHNKRKTSSKRANDIPQWLNQDFNLILQYSLMFWFLKNRVANVENTEQCWNTQTLIINKYNVISLRIKKKND